MMPTPLDDCLRTFNCMVIFPRIPFVMNSGKYDGDGGGLRSVTCVSYCSSGYAKADEAANMCGPLLFNLYHKYE